MDVLSAVGSFAVVAGLLTIIPGMDTALVLRAAVLQSSRHAFATALGVATGSLIWGAGAAVGVSALLTTSTVAYAALKVVGAVYMVYLGGRLLKNAIWAPPDSALAPLESAPATPDRVWRAYRRGAVTNLVNPKIGAFYVAVLPQFIPEGASPLGMGLLLALVHDIEGLLWFTLLILGAAHVRSLLRRRSAIRAVDATTGAVLVGFGVKLGLSR